MNTGCIRNRGPGMKTLEVAARKMGGAVFQFTLCFQNADLKPTRSLMEVINFH